MSNPVISLPSNTNTFNRLAQASGHIKPHLKVEPQPSIPMRDAPIHANRHMRVGCVGAGASGIFMAYMLDTKFSDFSLDVFEKNPDISGTWYENKYPGCACDVPAHNYTYSFEPKCDWSANYASSREIHTYFKDFVGKYDLNKYIKCNHEVIGASWDRRTNEWLVKVKSENGTFEKRYDFFINASGILNAWRWPAIPGLHDFRGKLLHSAAWDETVDVTGQHVGLIGNGSSGIQILPQMQKKAKHVTTFIREPTWVSPTRGMEYHQYTAEEKEKFRNDQDYHTQVRKETERGMASAFPLFINGSTAQKQTTAYMLETMKQKINDNYLASKLIPDFPVGCRRLTPGVDYLESLTLPNVTTLYCEISNVTERGCVTDDGTEHELDILICATGFDTSFKPRFPLLGDKGQNLAEVWKEEPRSYLGLAASGFPNYFMFLGPNCPIGNGPIIFSIELQGHYIAQFMTRWQKEDIVSFNPKREAVDDFIAQKDAFMQNTVWDSGCRSWYKNSEINKITALWPGSTFHYMETLTNARFDDFNIVYPGNRFSYLGNGFSQTELDPDCDIAYYIRAKDDGSSIFRPVQRKQNSKDARGKLNIAVGTAI